MKVKYQNVAETYGK